jgi:Tfp pilus assembly protein PilV
VARADAGGFTLVEVVLALFLIAVGVIATAPLFVYASRQNASGKDLGTAGAAAVRRMELLRSLDYDTLAPGGDLMGNVAGYFDLSDPEVRVRWTVAANPNPPAGTKVVTVRAEAIGPALGAPKDVTLITIRGG